MAHRFELVVFDVGSVLVQAGRSLAEEIALAGFYVDADRLAAFEARLSTLPHANIGAIEISRYAPLFAEASDGMFSTTDALRIHSASMVREHAGIASIFDTVEAADVETALLCNVQDAEWERLFPTDGSVPDFPTLLRAKYRFASHLMGFRKPDPRAYLEVERGTGRSAEAILFFDDREENVAAARERGWTAEVIDHRGDTAEQMLRLLQHHEVIA